MKIVVIGAGYVGLPIAVAFAKYHNVICFDINNNRINNLKKGIDKNKQILKKKILQKNLIFTSNQKDIIAKQIYIVTVPTPITKQKKPDLSMLKNASRIVGKSIVKKSIVIFESTTFPGCTEDVCVPLIERNSNMYCEKDFQVAYSPERLNPGDEKNTLFNITKIVASNNKKTLKKVKDLYMKICKSIYEIQNIKNCKMKNIK